MANLPRLAEIPKGACRLTIAAVLMASLYLTGCHQATPATTPPSSVAKPQPFGTSPVPSADEIPPSSPRAILDGTSTTQPAPQPIPAKPH